MSFELQHKDFIKENKENNMDWIRVKYKDEALGVLDGQKRQAKTYFE